MQKQYKSDRMYLKWYSHDEYEKHANKDGQQLFKIGTPTEKSFFVLSVQIIPFNRQGVPASLITQNKFLVYLLEIRMVIQLNFALI